MIALPIAFVRHLSRRVSAACCLAVVLLSLVGHVAAQHEPQVEIRNIRRVFHNGEHNAFTDLISFQGAYYLTFRSCPDGHMVHPTSSIIVLRSDDLSEWHEVHRFSVTRRDTRDPHFVEFQDRLFVYTGTWYSGETTLPRDEYDLNLHLGYAVYSDDGTDWSDPQMLDGTFGHYVWRAAVYQDKVYLCGRRKVEFEVGPRGEGQQVESLMLESDDGLIWRKRAVFQETAGDETAFLFDEEGAILAIGRRGSNHAQILRSEFPWQVWERSALDRYIGGPLLKRWGARTLVGGRQQIEGEGPTTSLYWLVENELREFARLPSGGDCSYPGFIALDENRAVVSWYSSHEQTGSGERITAIYMADLVIVD